MAKAQRKASEPTPVAEVIKAKKLPAKKAVAKKPVPKKEPAKKVTKTVKKKTPVKKPAKPAFTRKMFEQKFYSLGLEDFQALCQLYVENQLNFKIEQQPDYDHWFNYFKKIPASHTRLLVRIGQDILDSEAYAALRLWHDIISNPQRIAKVHQTSLTGPKGNEDTGIVAMALKNDRLGVLKATRDKLAEKLEKGAGARDTAAVARELTEVMTAIADYEKRSGPKKTTMLGQLLDGMPGSETPSPDVGKRPSKVGGGRRKTSFASRVTIKDVEND